MRCSLASVKRICPLAEAVVYRPGVWRQTVGSPAAARLSARTYAALPSQSSLLVKSLVNLRLVQYSAVFFANTQVSNKCERILIASCARTCSRGEIVRRESTDTGGGPSRSARGPPRGTESFRAAGTRAAALELSFFSVASLFTTRTSFWALWQSSLAESNENREQ